MKNMTGYLVDPEAKTVTRVTYNGDYKEIYKLIGCDTFTVVQVDDETDLFVDDEGLLNDPRYFFMLAGYPQPLAGKGLFLGHNDEGDTIECKLTLDEAKSLVVGYRELSMQGFVTKEEDDVEIFPGVRGFKITNTPVFGPPEPKDE